MGCSILNIFFMYFIVMYLLDLGLFFQHFLTYNYFLGCIGLVFSEHNKYI
jgi:hypothetical protein